jgi:VWFA-related protein
VTGRALAGVVALAAVLASGWFDAARIAARDVPQSARPAGPTSKTVWIHATVTGADGRLVTTLEQDDFVVLDDGEPRAISVFSREPMPMAVALMLDVSGSMAGVVPHLPRAAEAFLAQFIRGDRVNVGVFANDVTIGDRFYAHRGRILDAVRYAAGGAGLRCTPPSAGFAPSRRGAGSAVWDAVECGIQALEKDGEAVRRVVLAITDGVDNASYATSMSAAAYANQAGVMVYAVGMGSFLSAGALRNLVAATGGGYIALDERRDFTEAFRTIGDELHRQYLLGFEPGDSPAHRRLEVSVRNPDLTVRARRGYGSSRRQPPFSNR